MYPHAENKENTSSEIQDVESKNAQTQNSSKGEK